MAAYEAVIGLEVHALQILAKVPTIAVHHFTKADVVRHPLVGAIVNAYDNAEKNGSPS